MNSNKIGHEDTFVDLSCRVTGVVMRFSCEGKDVLRINNNQFTVGMSQGYNTRQTVCDVNVLISNNGFNGMLRTCVVNYGCDDGDIITIIFIILNNHDMINNNCNYRIEHS